MIVVTKEGITEGKFTLLLENTKARILKSFGGVMPKAMNGNIFESIVYDQMLISSVGTDFEGFVEQTGTHKFPDIIARKLYGVEVKMTFTSQNKNYLNRFN